MTDIQTRKENFLDSFLVGQCVARMDRIHKHLIQGEHKEALSEMNEAMRFMNEKIDKFYYQPAEEATSESK